MATVTTTTTLGTSNLRGASRQTRNNPARTSRSSRPNLRQNSLISNPPTLNLGVPEPHGFYPAISHFTDAISALPRDYRRHISLLKEVDAKAWLPEENLHTLLGQCLSERRTRIPTSTAQTVAGSTINAGDDTALVSATDSVNGATFDNVSQYSGHSADPAVVQRRQMYHSLRMNLMQMMVTMDEKNHVINNANEDLSRHIRRLDDIYPHVSDEISDDARLGSLKHWAYTDLNPPKKVLTASSRREAASGLAMMADNEIAHRSESRREAMLAAKKQRLNQHVDSDFDEKTLGRKAVLGKGKKPELVTETSMTQGINVGKRKKPEKTLGGTGMERSASGLRAGAIAMSREPSQQDNAKKRKASATVATVARKRLNVNQQESPKLVSSPLVNSYGKDAVKKSPALSNVRPVGRGRQNSGQTIESSKNRPSSSASYRNTTNMGTSLDASEMKTTAAATGRSIAEVKSTMKESRTDKGDKFVEDNPTANGDTPTTMRGGLLLERTASSRGSKRDHNHDDTKVAPSPRSVPSALANESKSATKGRASKTSTPVVSTFAEADGDDSGGANGSESGNAGTSSNKPKRPARPRMKDHHGLHDSLSPRGLPVKRTHGKSLSISSVTSSQKKGNQPPPGHRPRGLQYPEQYNSFTGKPMYPELIRGKSKSSSKDKATDDDVSDEEEITNEEEDEVKYCYCNGVSYGEMVACDSDECPREWFHLDCIGLKSLPKSAKWYCEECKQRTLKGKW